MGNEASSIKDFRIGQPLVTSDDTPAKFTVSPATNIHDGKKFSVFEYTKKNGKLYENVERNIEILRTTRHPFILKYLMCFDQSKSRSLVTEHVIPLDVAVEKQETEEIYTGLFNILEALIFLHERSLICHNNISVSSIYVTDEGVWKLADFENSNKVLRISKQSYEKDVKGYAEFALSVLEYLKDDNIPTINFMSKLQNEILLEENSSINISLKQLLDDQFFIFPFLEILKDLQNLSLKNSTEKRLLFSTLGSKLCSLSTQVTSRRLTPLLFSHMVITDPSAEPFLPYLFASNNDYCRQNNITSLYDIEYFKKTSLPHILLLFNSRDVVVRLIILKYLPYYVDCISRIILNEEVLPEIILGLKDENDSIVVETFKSLALLVPLLGSKTVVGGKAEKIFYDRKPDFSRSPSKTDTKASKTPRTTVTEIMQSSNSLTEVKTVNIDTDMLEEKKEKRLERERQREQQRLKREERRREREEAKSKKLHSQSSEDSNETMESHRNSINLSRQALQLDVSTTDEKAEEKDDINKSNGYNSEPDWEGFEAFSNSSDSEHTKGFNHETSHNQSDASEPQVDNPLQPSDDWNTWNDDNTDITIEDNKIIADIINKEVLDPPIITQDKIDTNTKALKLTSALKIKPNTTSETNSNKKTLNKKTKDFGDEFGIQISAASVREPDYFADMIPSVVKQKSVVALQTNNVSSKFNAMEMSTEDGEGGWGEDEEEDGWGNDDF